MSLSGGSGSDIIVDSQTVNIPAVNITGAVNAGGVSAGAVTATGDVTAGGDIASSGVVTCTGAVTQNVTNQTLSATVSNVNLGSGNSITCGSLIVDTMTLNGTGLTNSTGTLSLDATNLTTRGAVVGTSFKGDILSDNAVLCLRNGATPENAKFLGLSARAEQLQTSRNIAGEPFNGSGDIELACANMTDITSVGSGSIITAPERSKLATIEVASDNDVYIKRDNEETITLASSKVTIDNTLEVDSIIQSKVVDAVGGGTTTSNLELRRGGDEHIILSPDLTTLKEQTTFDLNANFTGGLKTNSITPAPASNNIEIKSAAEGTGDCFVGMFGSGDKSFRKVILGCRDNNSSDAHIYFVKNGAFRSYDGITPSDSRIKENQKEYNIEDSLNHIKSLKVKSYYNTEALANEVGLIAQEVAQVIPDVVSTHNLSEYGKLSDFKMLSYEKVFIHTIGAIQSLVKSNQELNARIVELEKK